MYQGGGKPSLTHIQNVLSKNKLVNYTGLSTNSFIHQHPNKKKTYAGHRILANMSTLKENHEEQNITSARKRKRSKDLRSSRPPLKRLSVSELKLRSAKVKNTETAIMKISDTMLAENPLSFINANLSGSNNLKNKGTAFNQQSKKFYSKRNKS